MTVRLEFARVTVGLDDRCKGTCGGDEEGLERKGELREEGPTLIERKRSSETNSGTGETSGDTTIKDGIVVGSFLFFGENFHVEFSDAMVFLQKSYVLSTDARERKSEGCWFMVDRAVR